MCLETYKGVLIEVALSPVDFYAETKLFRILPEELDYFEEKLYYRQHYIVLRVSMGCDNDSLRIHSYFRGFQVTSL